ncbi:MAG: hypothetical protein COV46_05130 [Deltaproteobacteria bacterium CG11_big_fil_rev_8_21_14_0_20_49_13]|nr:MAG: hypothetical protein COV46_05130 [Deltaproteobacteria bacterium CG11_big_fil_rev_8_21_14_0_20_49_13]
MAAHNSILESIGKTPIVRLNKIGKGLTAALFAKCEAANPGGSIKDRIALKMIEEAEKKGLLKRGSTIIEATAGNTGVALAQIAAVKGYKCLFVVPDKMSEEKVALLKAYGAKVVVTRSDVAPDSPENYSVLAVKIASKTNNSFMPSQFTNPSNPKTHYLTTGPETWRDMKGKISALVSGVGTGGTISGCGRYLKERDPKIKMILADPKGSLLSGGNGSPWLVEGVGEDYFPKTYKRSVVDDIVVVTDKESFLMARRLAREEGIFAGGSSGTALAAAVKYCKKNRVGGNVVIILPDTGRNYLSKCHSDEWMKKKGFL